MQDSFEWLGGHSYYRFSNVYAIRCFPVLAKLNLDHQTMHAYLKTGFIVEVYTQRSRCVENVAIKALEQQRDQQDL